MDGWENVTKEIFESYFTRRDLIPACYVIDIKKIIRLYKQGVTEFYFYVNKHKLVWFVIENEVELGITHFGYLYLLKLNHRDFILDYLIYNT